jgi:hypothetical protein
MADQTKKGPAAAPCFRSFFADNPDALVNGPYRAAAAAFDSGLANLELSIGALSSTLVT